MNFDNDNYFTCVGRIWIVLNTTFMHILMHKYRETYKFIDNTFIIIQIT